MREANAAVTIGWYAAIKAVSHIVQTGDIERFIIADVKHLRDLATNLEARMKAANTYAYNRGTLDIHGRGTSRTRSDQPNPANQNKSSDEPVAFGGAIIRSQG